MAISVLSNLNLGKNELVNAVVENGTEFPTQPEQGQIFYKTTDNTLYVYNGTEWVSSSGGTQTTITLREW